MLLKGRRPSLGLEFMKEAGILDEFPELRALVGCPQDPEWHPEGDVWEHTLMVVDAASGMRSGDPIHDLTLMLAALCHDLGKPSTTVFADGRWRSYDHEQAGEAPTRTFLGRLRGWPEGVPEAVIALVVHHLAPHHFLKGRPAPGGYRRLARKMGVAGTTMEMLEKVARADHLGRTTEEARAGQFPAGDFFLEEVRRLNVDREPPRDVVMGRHLLARGISPGPHMGPILARCREVQDDTGLAEPDEILKRVLG